jgi:acyl-CoA-dependent ceramide synthase
MGLRKIADAYHPVLFVAALGYILSRDDASTFFTVSGGRKAATDTNFVVGMVVVWTLARWLLHRLILGPVARAAGLAGAKVRKFQEAGSFALYYCCMWSWEMWVFPQEGWLYSPSAWYEGYPHTEMSGNLKFFYLGGMLAFWLHALVVLFLEKPRGDFVQMLSHHLLTLTMIAVSYHLNFTRVGAALMIEQDLADTMLYWAKLFNYLGETGNSAFEMMSNVTFVVFAVTWAVTRHGLFFIIYGSIITEFPKYIEEGRVDGEYQAHWWVRPAFLTMLAVFQGLLLFWFSLMLKVIIKVLKSGDVKVTDTRSDDEDSDDEEEQSGKKKKLQ